MSRRTTQAARSNLEQQQAAGTHRPASTCRCGTWRTPGQQHTRGDVGPEAKSVGGAQCTD